MQPKNEIEQTSLWARRMLRDPITIVLQEHSHLTHVQLETILIDYLVDGFGEDQLDYEAKAALRKITASPKTQGGVSRGAFNRSLSQARKNVAKSIFTIVLLGYLGLFESPSLLPYQNLAETLRSYARDYDLAATKGKKPTPTHLRTLKQAESRIIELIEELAQPLALKPK